MTDLTLHPGNQHQDNQPQLLAAARKALAEADTLAKMVKIIDYAEAVRVTARKVGISHDAQNDWAEYKLDAERKAGQMLAQMQLHGGDRRSSEHDVNLKLADLNVEHHQSSRWQRIARLAEDIYNAFKTDTRAAGKEVTEAGVIQLAKRFERENEIRDRATAAADIMPEDAIVTCASYHDWLPTQPDCDLLLTDPPYATDIEDVEAFANHWLPMALAKVKPTGRAYICIGSYPNELRAYLNTTTPDHLILDDVLGWTYRNTIGPQPTHSYKRNWQAILYYRGHDAPRLDCPLMVEQFSMQDIGAPTAPTTGRWHTWQKPDLLAERFIRHATQPGDLVLDPFTCTGTFLLAAARLGRKAQGCDNDPDNLAIALQRGCRRD